MTDIIIYGVVEDCSLFYVTAGQICAVPSRASPSQAVASEEALAYRNSYGCEDIQGEKKNRFWRGVPKSRF